MERAIRENDYVLIICTPNYCVKADQRRGGVGYEGDIMTAEVRTRGNHRKFIPILAASTWNDSSPSWLRGKYYVDLTDPENYVRNYRDLVATMLGVTRPAPQSPPRGDPASSVDAPCHDPVRIVGVIVDEVTEPRLDATPGSALYDVPFRLTRTPSSVWSTAFLRGWRRPSRYTSMHRPGIASVIGDRIVLSGTTVEEVERYHRATLVLCVDVANQADLEHSVRSRAQAEQRQRNLDSHRAKLEAVATTLRFGEP